MTTRMEVPQGSFELRRWRVRPRSPLRAWDAADEYVLGHLAETSPPGLRWAVVNDAFGALVCGLHAHAPVTIGDSWTAFAAAERNLEANGLPPAGDRVVPRGELPMPDPLDVVVIKVPKTGAFLEEQLRRLRPAMHEATVVVGAAMARHVHRSTLAAFERIIGPTSTSLARKKARLVHAALDTALEPGPSPFPTTYRLPTGQTVVSHANVFSRDRLDAGTALLIDNLPRDMSGTVVDLGCGNGVIALRAASDNPGIDLVLRDDSFDAVASATATLAAAGIDGDVAAGDGVADVDDGSVDVVLCNPPFHDDHAVGDEVAWSMFTGARRVLRRGGELRIVGNRHLGYHTKLERIFGNVQVVTSNPGFVVLSSIRT